MLERFNPSLYTDSDAATQLSKIRDRGYALGSETINPNDQMGKAKVWSMTPGVLYDIQRIVNEASHVHLLPFIMGTYNMREQEMRMNDICLTDPYSALLIGTGGLEGFGVPLLRGLYFAGRRGWWRHESIHARHHFQMAQFLAESDNSSREPWDFERKGKLDEAGETIHESGIEEVLTRWQALKESDGIRERAISALTLALYMEYAPFTGPRNAFIDAKERSIDLVDNTVVRRALKLGIGVGAFVGPPYLDREFHYIKAAAEMIDDLIPFSDEQIEGVMGRGVIYAAVSVISALLSSKEKGKFDARNRPKQEMEESSAEDGTEHMPTNEYKFPYTYNPITATTRTLGLLLYLNRIWDKIPHFRQLQSRKGIDQVKREIDDRSGAKLNEKQHAFTMQVVEEGLRPLEKRRKSSYPIDVYVKGMVTPALYLNSRDLYVSPSK